jgi:hypothetical protein
MTPVMTRVIVRSDAPSYRYDHWVRYARHRGRHLRSLGPGTGAVVSALFHTRRVTGVATRRTLWSSGPRWGAVTVNGPEGASAAGVAVTVNGPEGAPAAGGHADHADTGLSGDPSGARDGAPPSARDGAQPVPDTAPCLTQVCPATRWRSWWRCQRGVPETAPQPVPETAPCQTQVCPAPRWRSWWRWGAPSRALGGAATRWRSWWRCQRGSWTRRDESRATNRPDGPSASLTRQSGGPCWGCMQGGMRMPRDEPGDRPCRAPSRTVP